MWQLYMAGRLPVSQNIATIAFNFNMEWYARRQASICTQILISMTLLRFRHNWPPCMNWLRLMLLSHPRLGSVSSFRSLCEQIKVIFDGVNTNLCPPDSISIIVVLKEWNNGHVIEISESVPLLTYATRGMDKRGFAEFFRSQKQIKNLHVVVVAMIESPIATLRTSIWKLKQQLMDELKDQLDLTRLHFPGLINYGELLQLFQRSDLHCYFTRPYVISWGLFQAAACGSPLLVNRFPGIDDVFRDLQRVTLVDLDAQVELNHQVVHALQVQNKEQPISNLRLS